RTAMCIMWQGYLGNLLRLTLLVPNVVGAVLNGQQVPGFGLPCLLARIAKAWEEQRAAIHPDRLGRQLERVALRRR
ncbi:MAG TPA: hypothetical protein VM536_18690, partial [Chloroflexia bacterium]|nr:hypothetical protein [Chloroflexia bacterium]